MTDVFRRSGEAVFLGHDHQHGPLRSSRGSWMASMELSLLPFDTREDVFFCGGVSDGEEN